MTKQSHYDPDELQRRLQEIEAGTGEPYIPGEDPAIDAAMLMRDANHPILSDEKMLAIGAGLLITASTLNLPTLSEQAFNNIGTMLQAQLQLQSAPQPVMSDEAVNALDAQLRLQSAPRPVMSDETLLRIEQQLLQTARPIGSFMSAAAVILVALFGVLITTGIMLNSDPNNEPTETEVIVIPDEITNSAVPQIELVVPTEEYTSGIGIVVLTIPPTEIAATAEPMPEAEATLPEVPTEEPTIAIINSVFEVPPALVMEGPITSLDENDVVIYDLVFNYNHDTTLLDGYRVGDTVHIEGAVNPYTDAYLILSIEPVYDGVPNRPVIVTGVSEEPDSSIDTPTDTNGGTPVSVTGADNGENPSTTGSTGGEPPSDECDDGDDTNQGRGQECSRGGSD
jgi:hypothetical protein